MQRAKKHQTSHTAQHFPQLKFKQMSSPSSLLTKLTSIHPWTYWKGDIQWAKHKKQERTTWSPNQRRQVLVFTAVWQLVTFICCSWGLKITLLNPLTPAALCPLSPQEMCYVICLAFSFPDTDLRVLLHLSLQSPERRFSCNLNIYCFCF